MGVQGVNNSMAYAGNTVNVTKQSAPAVELERVPLSTTGSDNTTNRAGNVSDQMVKDAINEANSKLKINNRRCQFTYEKDINRVAVKLIDEETGEVIREIPSEETLDMLRKLQEMAGLMVDEQR